MVNTYVLDFLHSSQLWNSKPPVENLIENFAHLGVWIGEKNTIGPTVNFWVLPLKKSRRIPPQLRPAYETSTYATYIHNNFRCLLWRVSGLGLER